MGGERKSYAIFGAICVAVGFYFLATSGAPTATGKTAAVAFNDSGSAPGSGSGDAAGSGSGAPAGDSIFESQFFLGGVPTKPIEDEKRLRKQASGDEDPDILDPADKDNPVNPQTGRPYPNSVMQQFQTLREKFPNNSIIPKKKTPEEKQLEVENRKKMFGLQSLVAQGQANPEQITQYYEMRSKDVRDRIELLEYVTQSYGERMSDQVKGQYSKILEMNKKTLENYNSMRDRAIEKAQQR